MRWRTVFVVSAVSVGMAITAVAAMNPLRDLFELESAIPAIMGWPGPTRGEHGFVPERFGPAADLDPFTPRWWTEAEQDAAQDFVDITRVGLQTPTGRLDRLLIQFRGLPPAVGNGPVQDLAIGVTIDADANGSADWILGIDKRAPAGEHRAWVTEVATGETREAVGPPYGEPFDSYYPGEDAPRGDSRAVFTLDMVRDADPQKVQLYAWAALSQLGNVVVWDYAPDVAWISAR